jgi:hypothetical protein
MPSFTLSHRMLEAWFLAFSSQISCLKWGLLPGYKCMYSFYKYPWNQNVWYIYKHLYNQLSCTCSKIVLLLARSDLQVSLTMHTPITNSNTSSKFSKGMVRVGATYLIIDQVWQLTWTSFFKIETWVLCRMWWMRVVRPKICTLWL